MTTLRVALAQYPIDRFADFEAYAAKLAQWIADAAARGAQLVVFPEYGAMELTSLCGDAAADLTASIVALQELLPRVDALHGELARAHGIHVVAASAPFRRDDGRFVNVARLFAPSGAVGRQEKRVMTRFERESWHIAPGRGLRLFDTALGRIGIAICYDCEFPLLVRALAVAGADVILVPSCTDTLAGFHRVRTSALARALENQCYVATAPTVGEARWSPAVDVNVGAAGAFAPSDRFMPDDGIVIEGALNIPCLVCADLDLALLERVRSEGQVLNHRHWDEQPGRAMLEAVEKVSLR
jgi:predicted amidohydrolase